MLGIVFNRFNIAKIHSQLEEIIHSLWANPPLYGALIVNTILDTPKMRIEWLKTLNVLLFNF
jgi:aspartate aminotransferase, cytoplasmic